MAKLTLSNVATFVNDTSAVSTTTANNDAIEAAMENTLSLDGTTPNSMNADLDLNGNDLLNVKSISLQGGDTLENIVNYAEEWANKAEDSLVSAAAGGDQVDDYSALHHASKASVSATAAAAAETAAETAQGLAEDARDAAQAAANGIKWKDSCKCATTANITLSGEQTIDGILTSTDRVLVKDQTSAPENGVYVTGAAGWTRAAPSDDWDELVSMAITVEEGTVNGDKVYISTVDEGGTIDVTDVTFTILGGGDLISVNNLSDLDNAATSFNNIKQSATDSATGVVELATDTEVATGTDTSRAVTPAGVASHYSPQDRNLNAQTGTTYTLVLADANKVVTGSNVSLVTFTVPTDVSMSPNEFKTGTQIDIIGVGSGGLSVDASSGVQMNGVNGGATTLTAQFSAVTLLKIGANNWVIAGDHGGVA